MTTESALRGCRCRGCMPAVFCILVLAVVSVRWEVEETFHAWLCSPRILVRVSIVWLSKLPACWQLSLFSTSFLLRYFHFGVAYQPQSMHKSLSVGVFIRTYSMGCRNLITEYGSNNVLGCHEYNSEQSAFSTSHSISIVRSSCVYIPGCAS